MNAYVCLAIIVAMAISACVCVFCAYRKGITDGLELSKSSKLKEKTTVQKKAVSDANQCDEKSKAQQLQNLMNY